jgi:hypothetical protein
MAVKKNGYGMPSRTSHLGYPMLIHQILPLLENTVVEPGSDVRIVILASRGSILTPRKCDMIQNYRKF